MLKYGEEYVEKGLEYYDQVYQERVTGNLTKKAKALGFGLAQAAV